MKYKQIKNCRGCRSENLAVAIRLGEQNVVDFPLFEDEYIEPKIPLNLVICKDCNLVQLEHTVNKDRLFGQYYWYESGINQTMRDELAEIVRKAQAIVHLKEDDNVFDIGCNDGTLLRYYPRFVNTIGYEPSYLYEKADKNNNVIYKTFFKYSWGYDGTAKIITAISMFYDLDDPHAFLKDIELILARDGLFIIQMNYLPEMLKNGAYDNICHEHLEYYTLHTLEGMLKQHGLETFHVDHSPINGGSLRAFIKRIGVELSGAKIEGPDHTVDVMLQEEQRDQLGSYVYLPIFDRFTVDMDTNNITIRTFLEMVKGTGKSVYGYGASTRGSIILQQLGLDSSDIVAIAERNQSKVGRKVAGTDIPIIREQEMRSAHPDYVLVLPWFFRDEFLRREKALLDMGTKFIFPLPKFEVVSR